MSGKHSGGGGNWGGAGGSTMPMKLDAQLLPTNCGFGSGPGEKWICVGIVPELNTSLNLWVRVPVSSGGSHGGPA